MKQHDRVAFNQAGEILEHGIQYLAHVNALLTLMDTGEQTERVRMLLRSFTAEQQALKNNLERYQEDVADHVLNTFTQINSELPGELAGPDQPLTTLSLTQWLQALNRHLAELFDQVSQATSAGDVRAAFNGLADQVQAHERKLSKEYQRFEDL